MGYKRFGLFEMTKNNLVIHIMNLMPGTLLHQGFASCYFAPVRSEKFHFSISSTISVGVYIVQPVILISFYYDDVKLQLIRRFFQMMDKNGEIRIVLENGFNDVC